MAIDPEGMQALQLLEGGQVLNAILAGDVAQLHECLPDDADGLAEEDSSDGHLLRLRGVP